MGIGASRLAAGETVKTALPVFAVFLMVALFSSPIPAAGGGWEGFSPLPVRSADPFPIEPEDLTIDPSRTEKILNEIRLQKALEAILKELKLEIELEEGASTSTEEASPGNPAEMIGSEGAERPTLQLDFQVQPDVP